MSLAPGLSARLLVSSASLEGDAADRQRGTGLSRYGRGRPTVGGSAEWLRVLARASGPRRGRETPANGTVETVDVTPSPRILKVIAEIDFRPWQCIAELIDNSFDEFLNIRRSAHPGTSRSKCRLRCQALNTDRRWRRRGPRQRAWDDLGWSAQRRPRGIHRQRPDLESRAFRNGVQRLDGQGRRSDALPDDARRGTPIGSAWRLMSTT